MLSVQGVLDRVGPTLLRAVSLGSESGPVSDVVIAEAGRRTQLGAGDLVLGVAVGSARDAVELVRQCGEREAAALLLKPPSASASSVVAAAKAAGISLLEVRSGTGWAQLVWLLRTVVDAASDESEEAGEEAGSAGLGDLFQLADAVAAVVDAPVTIEDANSRVLAYSARQDLTDPARISTIMGRRIPDDVLARFRSRGVFRELSRGRTTIFVPAQRDGTLPRLIVPIRMGGELLGSMWAVVAEKVPEARAAAFADAGSVVALHLLRRRAAVDAQRRHSTEQVRALLAGRGSFRVAAAELGLADVPHRVVAIDTVGKATAGKVPQNSKVTEDELGAEGLRLALWERLTAGVGRRPAVAELNRLLYAVVPDEPGAGGWAALRGALSDMDTEQLLVAAGAPMPIAELPQSRAQAQETLGLLRAGLVAGRVADYQQAWAVIALHRAANAAAGAGVTEPGPLPVLREQDEANNTDYLDTLYEWLRNPGDPRAAGRALRIHPNTLRYRMRRITELTGADLDDPDIRLALLVQLVAMRWL
ncbi:MAG TPA: helix-turn-helix domain-containing protein [Pseudonocardiaceae bacterium]|nr:helix-turn-helix domain-containing protein [Pseudonocardiaceae bacterium]